MEMFYPASEVEGKFEEYFQKETTLFDRKKLDINVPDLPQTVETLRHNLREIERALFEILMQIEWFERRTSYVTANGVYNKPGRTKHFDFARADYFRRTFGYTPMFWKSNYFKVIRSYADDFFPDFVERTDAEFDYPYQHMNLECLFFVHKLPTRIKLLAEGERLQMNFHRFHDYVLAVGSKWQLEEEKQCIMYYSKQENTPPYYAIIVPFTERVKRRKNQV